MTTDIKKYSFKPGLAQEFEILDMATLYQQAEQELTVPHRAGFFHIIWFREGQPVHMVDFKPLQIESNSVLFLNKDIVHKFSKNNDFQGKIILFTDSFFCKTDTDSRYLRNTILFNDLFTVSQIRLDEKSSLFGELFALMEAEFKSEKDQYQSDILKNHLHNLLLLSERERRKQDFTEIPKGEDLDYVMLFKETLENQYKSIKQVSAYVAQIGITEKRLNRATSQVLGKSPKEIIDERIMLEAKRLLAHTGLIVKEIGFELGFEEPTNFIKFFRKHQQSTPAEFRTSLFL